MLTHYLNYVIIRFLSVNSGPTFLIKTSPVGNFRKLICLPKSVVIICQQMRVSTVAGNNLTWSSGSGCILLLLFFGAILVLTRKNEIVQSSSKLENQSLKKSSQQLPRLRLGPLKGRRVSSKSPCLVRRFRNYRDKRTRC